MAVNFSSFSANIPSGSSSIRHGDDQIRSDKSLFAAVINDEHYCTLDSASSASAGIHRPGSARIFAPVARASLGTPASADSAYRMAFTTDLESLHIMGASSASTVVYGKQPMGARYSGPWAIASGSISAVSFATVDYDVGSMTSSANTAKLVVSSAGSGRYLVSAYIQFGESVRSGTQRTLQIKKNGSTILTADSSSTGTSSGNGIELSCSAVDHAFATSDYYECLLFHDAGVSLSSIIVTGNFGIQRL